MSLTSFPEELLEQILADTVISLPTPHPRAPWHSSSTASSGKQTRGRAAPLLVCRAFHRIALPFFYHTLVLHSSSQSASLLEAFRLRPELTRAVRTLVLPAPSQNDAEVIQLLVGLRDLDVTLPNQNSSPDVEDLTNAVRDLRSLRALTVRKSPGTYLSQPAPRALLDALADAVHACPELTSTTLSFPLSADPALARFSGALAAAPGLRALRTPLPSVWAPAYVGVAENPALERICLGEEDSSLCTSPFASPSAASPSTASSSSAPRTERRFTSLSCSSPPRPRRPILLTALFLHAARPHTRLTELIKAGTDICVGGWRGRAATVGANAVNAYAYTAGSGGGAC
ncbi:hypothetical protein DFH06DRAFT_1121559 [Mycena polygramma]|nr:hypothetical protein DFH06DRAFT_1121559 [Mycena polygramma]